MKNASFHVLRVGLGITFLWIGVLILKQPQAWGAAIQPWAATLLPVPVGQAMLGTAVLDLAIGFFLLVGISLWIPALVAAAHLLVVLIVVGIDEVTVRDIGLLAGALALVVDRWPFGKKGSASAKKMLIALLVVTSALLLPKISLAAGVGGGGSFSPPPSAPAAPPPAPPAQSSQPAQQTQPAQPAQSAQPAQPAQQPQPSSQPSPSTSAQGTPPILPANSPFAPPSGAIPFADIAEKPKPISFCGDLSKMIQRVVCRLHQSQEEQANELAFQYLPEECRAMKSGGAQNACIDLYRRLQECWSFPVGENRIGCVKGIIGVPSDPAKEIRSCGLQKKKSDKASCIAKTRNAVYAFVKFRFYDLEERMEELYANKNVSGDAAALFITRSEQMKQRFNAARNNKQRSAVLRFEKIYWQAKTKRLWKTMPDLRKDYLDDAARDLASAS